MAVWEETERKCHRVNSLAAGRGPAPADIRRSEMTTFTCKGYDLVVKSISLFVTQGWGALVGSKCSPGSELILRHKRGRSK